MNRKVILSAVIVLLIGGGIFGYNYYQKIFGNNVVKTGFLFIKSSDKIDDVVTSLKEFIKDEDAFLWVAEKKKFTNIKGGKYKLDKGMSNNDLINLLRSGNQTPIKVSFNNQDTLEKLAGRIALQIEADSTSLIHAFQDADFLAKKGIQQSQMLGYFIPNTYEFFWNTSGDQFRDRMFKESQKFWNSDRLSKAKALKMTPNEVMALASIVQKEASQVSERSRVAGLYLNRIKIGMPLQADPTIIYILKQQNGQDFQVKRVLYKDLKIKSPYNTYLNRGLPPSLIAMPDISSIDGVLNYEKHNYIYMCVNVEKIGYHAFASTSKEHSRNAKKYHNWLNKLGIKR
ncbi:endolytic transglycosylase MltG [Pseudotenacibaculum sp. MALMAid0570]|uniref:endolytic transglycosylase MltG n=1 Tax=Pseudotenacibaculum sp. MALMAid0570 TaxID=3143938 RepID=UPI0032DF625D